MEQVTLDTQSRTPGGKGAARRVRREGGVPGVVYGHRLEARALRVDRRTLEGVLRSHSGNVLLNLSVDGEAPEGLAAIIKELQTDPTTDEMLAIDFQWVSLTEHVTVSVAIHLEGVSDGVQEGGVLDQLLYEASVSCLPLEIPEQLTLDITGMRIGDTRQASDLQVAEGVELLVDPEDTVVTVRAPVVIEEPEPEEDELAEGEEPAEGEEGAEAEEGAKEAPSDADDGDEE